MATKVLVVDDDPDVRLFSVTVLEENGYEPLEAANGEEGLKVIKKGKTRTDHSRCIDASPKRYQALPRAQNG